VASLRFGLFTFNPETGELLRQGQPVHLQAQPAKVLALLVSAAGELVTRETLRDALWSDGTSVDFDRGLNFAVAQVRTALGDSAESPTFIRTVPKRGYQFIAPVSGLPPAQQPAPAPIAMPPASRRSVLPWIAVAAAVGTAALALSTFRATRSNQPRIAVARFVNETGNPVLDRLADTLTDSLVADLTSQTAGRHGVIGNAAILRQPRSFQDIDRIASTLQARYVILGQLKQDGPRIRLLAHLIRLPEKTHLKVSRLEVTESASASQLAAQIAGDFAAHLNSPPSASN
jgi:DNA-binding winged helix-turn-helix (wHTH) protein/TolB-like protein